MSEFKGLKRVVVKEELVALTGDLEKAIILNQFIYWSQRINDFDKFVAEERDRAEAEGMEVVIDFQNGWIYKDMEELKDEIMTTSSISTMSRKLQDLVDQGWLDRRNNPKYKWDKRYQYRVNLLSITKDLFEIGYILQDYKIDTSVIADFSNSHSASSRMQNESTDLQNESTDLQNERALSEITTDTTNRDYNHSFIQENEGTNEDINSIIDSNERKELQEIIDNSYSKDFKEKDTIDHAIKMLYYTDRFLKIDNMNVPAYEVRQNLKKIDYSILEAALHDYKLAAKENKIKYPVKYFSKCLYHSIINYDFKLTSEVMGDGLI